MSKREIEATPPAAEVKFHLTLRDEADMKPYLAALDKTRAAFGDIMAAKKAHDRKTVSVYWDMGELWTEFFNKSKSKFGSISNEHIDQIAKDMSDKGQDMTAHALRFSLNIRNSYEKDRILELVDGGFCKNHFDVLLQIGDKKYRAQLEDKAMDAGMTGADIRGIVRDIARKPTEAKKLLTDTAQAQYKRKAAGKKSKDSNPLRQVPRMLAKLAEWQDICGSVVIGLDSVDNIVEDDQRKQLTKELEELSEECKNFSETVMGVRESIQKALKSLSAEAPASPAAVAEPAEAVPEAGARRKVVTKL